MPPYPPVPPTPAGTVKPRNRTALVALILALLAWLAAALGIWLIVASHAWTDECLVNTPLDDAGTLCLVLGALLSVGAGVTGLISLLKPRARGAYRAIGVAAMVMGAVGVMVCLFLISHEVSPHAINPAYLHTC
jgi:uncharacterized membrane protein YbhN (UPF0104 family)